MLFLVSLVILKSGIAKSPRLLPQLLRTSKVLYRQLGRSEPGWNEGLLACSAFRKIYIGVKPTSFAVVKPIH